MTIPSIGAINSVLSTLGAGSAGAAPDAGVASGGGANFASLLSKGIGSVESAQNKADSLAIKAATGDLTDVHDYSIAATQASLATELATSLRTKGVEAFNQIMGMQA
jgi:flagellar hook-basal body complex protein FliE